MYKVGSKVVYKKDVCNVTDIKEMGGTEYYVLVPVNDDSLKISVPVTSNAVRDVLTKKKALELINNMSNIEVIPSGDIRSMDYRFRELMIDGSYESLMTIVKTVYLRNQDKSLKKKRLSDKEEAYYKEAEKYLFTELCAALDLKNVELKKLIKESLEGK